MPSPAFLNRLTKLRLLCIITVLVQLIQLTQSERSVVMIHLDYRDSRPIYSQIIDGFRNQIRAGILQPGDKLPSVRELAAELTINPNTIQRAYREMESAGYIASVPGKGSFVCHIPAGTPANRQEAWDALHHAMEQLTTLGISKEMIIEHIRQGGDNNA